MGTLNFLAFLCFGFAIVDFAGMFFGYDLTGVSWSPIAAGVIGSILKNTADSSYQKLKPN